MHGLLLISAASDYESAVAKGVVSMLTDFDERGFFERVLIAFPVCRTSREVRLSTHVVVRDIGMDWLPRLLQSRPLRLIGAPLHILRTVIILSGCVRRQNLHLVRATDPCFAGPMAWIVSRVTGRPFCVSIHADFEKRYELGGEATGLTVIGSRKLARLIERLVMSHADMVLPIRESLRPYALALGARPDRVRIIPHGTDLEVFVRPTEVDISAQFNIPKQTSIISFAGRLAAENYVDDIVELARRLGGSRDDFVVLMAGRGPDESRLRAIVETDQILKRVVRFVGFQPRHVVAAIRQASRISLCLMGGFSLIEACAAGSPVVAYDVEWHAELVREGLTGFLVAERDLDRLVDVVTKLLDDPTLAVGLGNAAKTLAVSHHSIEVTTIVKQQCYQELLDA